LKGGSGRGRGKRGRGSYINFRSVKQKKYKKKYVKKYNDSNSSGSTQNYEFKKEKEDEIQARKDRQKFSKRNSKVDVNDYPISRKNDDRIHLDNEQQIAYLDGGIFIDPYYPSQVWTLDVDIEGGYDKDVPVLNWSFSSDPCNITNFLTDSKNELEVHEEFMKHYYMSDTLAMDVTFSFLNHTNDALRMVVWPSRVRPVMDSLTNEEVDDVIDSNFNRVFEIFPSGEIGKINLRVKKEMFFDSTSNDVDVIFGDDKCDQDYYYFNFALEGMTCWPQEVGNFVIEIVYDMKYCSLRDTEKN
jgi:hypothetical protein